MRRETIPHPSHSTIQLSPEQNGADYESKCDGSDEPPNDPRWKSGYRSANSLPSLVFGPLLAAG
jgi:hypothetical protein